jgi:hypothetical protein
MFQSCAGHNILQTPSGIIGSGRRGRVPVKVARTDARGGVVEIDGSEVEPEVFSWKRRVEWHGSGQVSVEDNAVLFEPRDAGEEWFRWHIGSTEKPAIAKNDDGTWKVVWGSNTLTLSANRALLVDAVAWRNDVLPEKKHYCVVVKAAQSGAGLKLTTELSFPRPVPGLANRVQEQLK